MEPNIESSDQLTVSPETAFYIIVKARELVSRFAQMPSLKALVAERTGHAGWERLRPPLETLPAAQRKELLADAAAFATAA